MIDISAEVVGAEAVQLRFATLPDLMRQRVRASVQALGLELLRKVKAEKLSGQVLNVRTGRLRRSVNEETRTGGDSVTSTVGTNVSYARFWELGFRGVEQVREHLRLGHPVRAHTRTVNVAPRSFLVSSLDEMRGRIAERLTAAAAVGP